MNKYASIYLQLIWKKMNIQLFWILKYLSYNLFSCKVTLNDTNKICSNQRNNLRITLFIKFLINASKDGLFGYDLVESWIENVI